MDFFRKIKDRKLGQIQNIASMIGLYYLDKYGYNKYNETVTAIISLGITKIDFKRETISITISRPGLFIGRKGENIDKFIVYMKKHSKFEKLIIKEERVLSWLIPVDPNERYYDWDF